MHHLTQPVNYIQYVETATGLIATGELNKWYYIHSIILSIGLLSSSEYLRLFLFLWSYLCGPSCMQGRGAQGVARCGVVLVHVHYSKIHAQCTLAMCSLELYTELYYNLVLAVYSLTWRSCNGMQLFHLQQDTLTTQMFVLTVCSQLYIHYSFYKSMHFGDHSEHCKHALHHSL